MGCGCSGNGPNRRTVASMRPRIIINPTPANAVAPINNQGVTQQSFTAPIINKVNEIDTKLMQKIRREAIRNTLGHP
jgi:hypothetical protein